MITQAFDEILKRFSKKRRHFSSVDHKRYTKCGRWSKVDKVTNTTNVLNDYDTTKEYMFYEDEVQLVISNRRKPFSTKAGSRLRRKARRRAKDVHSTE